MTLTPRRLAGTIVAATLHGLCALCDGLRWDLTWGSRVERALWAVDQWAGRAAMRAATWGRT